MPTSGTPRASRALRGFTLLELVVVLGLMGLATALVAPAGIRTIETWRRATDVDAALGSLSAMGARAHNAGTGVALEAGELPAGAVAGIPEGWSVLLDGPLRIQANGACSAAVRGTLVHRGGYAQPFTITMPFCETVRREADA